jgi:hypothetical protein
LFPCSKGHRFDKSIICCIYLVNFQKYFLDFISVDVIKTLRLVGDLSFVYKYLAQKVLNCHPELVSGSHN